MCVMPNILSWNYRGTGARHFPCLIQDLKMKHDIQVLIITEPQISGRRADNIIKKMGYSSSYRVEAVAFQEEFGFCGKRLM